MNSYQIINKFERIINGTKKHSEIQMLDNRRITIECCKGIIGFDENLIKLRLAKCNMTVVGLELKMKNFTKTGVDIRGKIHSITFEESGGKE